MNNCGYLWFAQNTNEVDYVRLSIELAKSIKKFNQHNRVCVIVDKGSFFQNSLVDYVIQLSEDASAQDSNKFANEYKAFALSPFTHTIKLEADMLFTSSTDWWWNHLRQHDLVFSVDCFNYEDEIVVQTPYRKLFETNNLPNVYNGLTYFRRSQKAKDFFKLCKMITLNWKYVSEHMLINCHDAYPSTDVVYALAYRIMDPTQQELINYPWFKFIHGKPEINRVFNTESQYNYLNPFIIKGNCYLANQRLNRIWHYYDKTLFREYIHGRTF